MTYSLLLYALPAAIALTCKIYFLSRLSLSSVLSRAFVVLCVVMVMQNAMEVLGYLGLVYSETLARLSADFYMCFTYGLGTALLYFSCAVCRVYKPYFSYVLGGLTALLVIMHINGCIVTSYSNVGYAQIAVQGEYFYVFELYAAATIVLSMLLMLWDVVFCTNYDLKIRTLVVLVGLSPLSFVFCSIAADYALRG